MQSEEFMNQLLNTDKNDASSGSSSEETADGFLVVQTSSSRNGKNGNLNGTSTSSTKLTTETVPTQSAKTLSLDIPFSESTPTDVAADSVIRIFPRLRKSPTLPKAPMSFASNSSGSPTLPKAQTSVSSSASSITAANVNTSIESTAQSTASFQGKERPLSGASPLNVPTLVASSTSIAAELQLHPAEPIPIQNRSISIMPTSARVVPHSLNSADQLFGAPNTASIDLFADAPYAASNDFPGSAAPALQDLPTITNSCVDSTSTSPFLSIPVISVPGPSEKIRSSSASAVDELFASSSSTFSSAADTFATAPSKNSMVIPPPPIPAPVGFSQIVPAPSISHNQSQHQQLQHQQSQQFQRQPSAPAGYSLSQPSTTRHIAAPLTSVMAGTSSPHRVASPATLGPSGYSSPVGGASLRASPSHPRSIPTVMISPGTGGVPTAPGVKLPPNPPKAPPAVAHPPTTAPISARRGVPPINLSGTVAPGLMTPHGPVSAAASLPTTPRSPSIKVQTQAMKRKPSYQHLLDGVPTSPLASSRSPIHSPRNEGGATEGIPAVAVFSPLSPSPLMPTSGPPPSLSGQVHQPMQPGSGFYSSTASLSRSSSKDSFVSPISPPQSIPGITSHQQQSQSGAGCHPPTPTGTTASYKSPPQSSHPQSNQSIQPTQSMQPGSGFYPPIPARTNAVQLTPPQSGIGQQQAIPDASSQSQKAMSSAKAPLKSKTRSQSSMLALAHAAVQPQQQLQQPQQQLQQPQQQLQLQQQQQQQDFSQSNYACQQIQQPDTVTQSYVQQTPQSFHSTNSQKMQFQPPNQSAYSQTHHQAFPSHIPQQQTSRSQASTSLQSYQPGLQLSASSQQSSTSAIDQFSAISGSRKPGRQICAIACFGFGGKLAISCPIPRNITALSPMDAGRTHIPAPLCVRNTLDWLLQNNGVALALGQHGADVEAKRRLVHRSLETHKQLPGPLYIPTGAAVVRGGRQPLGVTLYVIEEKVQSWVQGRAKAAESLSERILWSVLGCLIHTRGCVEGERNADTSFPSVEQRIINALLQEHPSSSTPSTQQLFAQPLHYHPNLSSHLPPIAMASSTQAVITTPPHTIRTQADVTTPTGGFFIGESPPQRSRLPSSQDLSADHTIQLQQQQLSRLQPTAPNFAAAFVAAAPASAPTTVHGPISGSRPPSAPSSRTGSAPQSQAGLPHIFPPAPPTTPAQSHQVLNGVSFSQQTSGLDFSQHGFSSISTGTAATVAVFATTSAPTATLASDNTPFGSLHHEVESLLLQDSASKADAARQCASAGDWALALLIASNCGKEIRKEITRQYADKHFVKGSPLHLLAHLYMGQTPRLFDVDSGASLALAAAAGFTVDTSGDESLLKTWPRLLAALVANKGESKISQSNWRELARSLGKKLLARGDLFAAHTAFLCSGALPGLTDGVESVVNGNCIISDGLPKPLYTCVGAHGDFIGGSMTECLEYALLLSRASSQQVGAASMVKSISGILGGLTGSGSVSGSSSTDISTGIESDMTILLLLRAQFSNKLQRALMLADIGLVTEAKAHVEVLQRIADICGVDKSQNKVHSQPQNSSQRKPLQQPNASVGSTSGGSVATLVPRPLSPRLIQVLGDFTERLQTGRGGISSGGQSLNAGANSSLQPSTSQPNVGSWFSAVLNSSVLKDFVEGPDGGPTTTLTSTPAMGQGPGQGQGPGFGPGQGQRHGQQESGNTLRMQLHQQNSSGPEMKQHQHLQQPLLQQGASTPDMYVSGPNSSSSSSSLNNMSTVNSPQLQSQPQMSRPRSGSEFPEVDPNNKSRKPEVAVPKSINKKPVGGGIVDSVKKSFLKIWYPDAIDASANLDSGLEAYYDAKLGRWVFPGESDQATDDPAAGPPPTIPLMPVTVGPGGSGGDNPGQYDPLAALMAPPFRNLSQPIPGLGPSPKITQSISLQSMSQTQPAQVDPLAALMAPPPRFLSQQSIHSVSAPAFTDFTAFSNKHQQTNSSSEMQTTQLSAPPTYQIFTPTGVTAVNTDASSNENGSDNNSTGYRSSKDSLAARREMRQKQREASKSMNASINSSAVTLNNTNTPKTDNKSLIPATQIQDFAGEGDNDIDNNHRDLSKSNRTNNYSNPTRGVNDSNNGEYNHNHSEELGGDGSIPVRHSNNNLTPHVHSTNHPYPSASTVITNNTNRSSSPPHEPQQYNQQPPNCHVKSSSDLTHEATRNTEYASHIDVSNHSTFDDHYTQLHYGNLSDLDFNRESSTSNVNTYLHPQPQTGTITQLLSEFSSNQQNLEYIYSNTGESGSAKYPLSYEEAASGTNTDLTTVESTIPRTYLDQSSDPISVPTLPSVSDLEILQQSLAQSPANLQSPPSAISISNSKNRSRPTSTPFRRSAPPAAAVLPMSFSDTAATIDAPSNSALDQNSQQMHSSAADNYPYKRRDDHEYVRPVSKSPDQPPPGTMEHYQGQGQGYDTTRPPKTKDHHQGSHGQEYNSTRSSETTSHYQGQVQGNDSSRTYGATQHYRDQSQECETIEYYQAQGQGNDSTKPSITTNEELDDIAF